MIHALIRHCNGLKGLRRISRLVSIAMAFMFTGRLLSVLVFPWVLGCGFLVLKALGLCFVRGLYGLWGV